MSKLATAYSADVPEFTTRFGVNALSPAIGAEIRDLDLSEKIDSETLAALRQVLLDRKVIFFRDQEITTEQHLEFARLFGEVEVHPFLPALPDYPEVLSLTHDRERPGRENIWHSDVTWRLEPSLGSVLRATEVPEHGGDTLFSCMYSAYEGLSDEIKSEINGRTAIHDFERFRFEMRMQGKSEAEIEEANKLYPEAEHPVVRTHPETGRKALYVNSAFTRRIVDLEPERSKELLDFLYSRAAIPEYQCRFRWQKNSIAFWDNRACQHYAVSDYWPAQRSVERVTIIGDRPR